MGNSENPLMHVLDVVKHLVSTHVHWNGNMSQNDAVQKLEKATEDAAKTVGDVETKDVPAAVEDGVQTVEDVTDVVKDVTK